MEKQVNLLGDEIKEDWEKEYLDMPEFINEDKEAVRQVIVSFKTENDVKEFFRLIDQKFTPNTRSIWFPKEFRDKPGNYLYTYIKEEDINE